ncbi:MAG: hypothetical protein ACKOBW_17420 [Planctomycetota bacterium]
MVRHHLGDKVPVSHLADEYQIQPSMIDPWGKQVLDQAERAFRQPDGQCDQKLEEARARRQQNRAAALPTSGWAPKR